MEFTNKEFNAFKKDVKNALSEIEKKYQVEIGCGNIRYSEYEFEFKVNVVKKDDKTDGKKRLFEEQCRIYGFSAEDYEREFLYDNKHFKLIGFNPRSPKNCCSILCIEDNTVYKCGSDLVKAKFAGVI